MPFVRFFKYTPLALALPLSVWLLSPAPGNEPQDRPGKVNLALRRTADGLLRAAGDGTSRIPAVEHTGAGIWRIRLEQPFDYDQLPPLLQASLDRYGIRQPYEVAVRRCEDAVIDLGYHQLDYLQDSTAPCVGRAMPEGCHYIEIIFSGSETGNPVWAGIGSVSMLVLAAAAGFGLFRRKRPAEAPAGNAIDEPGDDYLDFGRSRLDMSRQELLCGGVRQQLTFREAKLLRLFATHPGRLLEREFILREVWADEGVLVGRSVDVFVSRLRKKLAADPSVGIVAVHGVGYRLETGKNILATQ